MRSDEQVARIKRCLSASISATPLELDQAR